MGWKIYLSGLVIPTSRAFLREQRRTKVFTRTEAAKWKNDPDLMNKNSGIGLALY